MSNIIPFRGPTRPGDCPETGQDSCTNWTNEEPRVRIVASWFENHFRYFVFPDEQSLTVVLDTFSPDNARATAAKFSANIIEVGPPEAFGRAPT